MNDYDDYNKPVSEEDVIHNSKLEHLYNHEFEGGRFFQVVFSNHDEVHIKLASRTLLKVVYIRKKMILKAWKYKICFRE